MDYLVMRDHNYTSEYYNLTCTDDMFSIIVQPQEALIDTVVRHACSLSIASKSTQLAISDRLGSSIITDRSANRK